LSSPFTFAAVYPLAPYFYYEFSKIFNLTKMSPDKIKGIITLINDFSGGKMSSEKT
jgi:hypothetical protein